MGQSPKGTSYNKEGKGIPLLNGAADFNKKGIFPKQNTTEPTKLSEKGDILLCIRATIGNAIISDRTYCLGRGVAAIRVNKTLVEPMFALYLIEKKIIDLAYRALGSTIKGIKKTDLDNLEFDIPSLPVQKRIISILEKAEKLKQKREETNKETQKIIQSIFYDMFGDPVKNEKGWEVKRLDEVTEVIMGQSPSGDSYNITKQGTPFFQGKAEFGIKYPTVKKWTTKPSKIALPGDTLISVRAPVGTVNMCNINCCIGRGLSAIRVKNNLNQEFLFRLLQLLERNIALKGTGSTFKAISGKDLRAMKIIIPPLSLQQEFAKRVQLLESIQSKQQKSTQEINTLFDALMQKAFKGELVE